MIADGRFRLDDGKNQLAIYLVTGRGRMVPTVTRFAAPDGHSTPSRDAPRSKQLQPRARVRGSKLGFDFTYVWRLPDALSNELRRDNRIAQ
jgi:hypothetical protein